MADLSWITNQADILINVAKSLGPVEHLISGAAYLVGWGFIFKGVYALKLYGEMRTMHSQSTNMKEPIMYLLIGAMFVYLPTTIKMLLATTFGGDATILAYAPVDSPNSAIDTLFGSGSALGRPLMMVIQIVGLIAFVRGWIQIARGSSQGQGPGSMGKGLMHVFGGILAMNIVATLQILNNTLYGT